MDLRVVSAEGGARWREARWQRRPLVDFDGSPGARFRGVHQNCVEYPLDVQSVSKARPGRSFFADADGVVSLIVSERAHALLNPVSAWRPSGTALRSMAVLVSVSFTGWYSNPRRPS